MNWLVTVISSYEFNNLTEITQPNHMSYCQRWGYDYRHHKCQFPPRTGYGNVNFYDMLNSFEKYDGVVSLDSDTLFTNFTKSLDDIFAPSCDQQIAMEKLGGSKHNNGVVFWRSCESSRVLIKNILDCRIEYEKHPWSWQKHMSDMLESKSPFVKNMAVVDPHVMNSLGTNCNAPEGQGDIGVWKPGDFIIHFFGLNVAGKILFAKMFLAGELFGGIKGEIVK